MSSGDKPGRTIFLILAVSALVRALAAGFTELGNDEVYYWTYALYPALSHFDHPPMIGIMLQAFSLNLTFDNEFFLRLGPLLLGTLNTWLIYLIARNLKDHQAGIVAALLYTSSVYALVISGTFALPDAPLQTFWLSSLLLLVKTVTVREPRRREEIMLLLAGLAIGLAILSKYSGIFLWVGAGLYILFCNRLWLKKPSLYAALLISLLVFLPVIIWNVDNRFISFTFHSARVEVRDWSVDFSTLLRELAGQILYQNPVNFIIIVMALIHWFLKHGNRNEREKLILFISFPVIVLFIGFSLFRSTLPHWSGPGYNGLLILAGVFLSEKSKTKSFRKTIVTGVVPALALTVMVVFAGILQIRTGIFFTDDTAGARGKKDISLEMYGWKETGRLLALKLENCRIGDSNGQITLISHRWFPAAHLDYYVCRPNGFRLLAMGSLDMTHKYAWINKKRGGFSTGMDAWYITRSNNFKDPEELYAKVFGKVIPEDTVPVYRRNTRVFDIYIYRLVNLLKLPEDPLPGEIRKD